MQTGGLVLPLLAVQLFGAQLQLAALPGGETFYALIDEAERYAEQGNWEKVQDAAGRLEHHVGKRYWMLQLLGDEEEYEDLKRDLARLKSAVRERSRMEVLLLLADIRSILGHIFSL